MKRVRFNIGGLMGLVALAALGLVALREARPESLHLLFLIALLLNLAAILTACLAGSRLRAFASGYLLLGCGYLALVAALPPLDGFVHEQLIALHILPNPVAGSSPKFTPYHVAAHSLLDMAAGVAGGLIALGLARASEDPEAA